MRLKPISMTHSPTLLLEHERFWAVNSAFEIDLAGCVNSEYAGAARVASAGGQTDFFRAAHASAGGAAVLALPARAGDGRPRIVGRLPAGRPPTSTGADLDYVVTEHGIASWRAPPPTSAPNDSSPLRTPTTAQSSSRRRTRAAAENQLQVTVDAAKSGATAFRRSR